MTSTYERAFAEGERAAWQDRQRGVFRQRPNEPMGAYSSAWWDGYCPRTSAWAVRPHQVAKPQVVEYQA